MKKVRLIILIILIILFSCQNKINNKEFTYKIYDVVILEKEPCYGDIIGCTGSGYIYKVLMFEQILSFGSDIIFEKGNKYNIVYISPDNLPVSKIRVGEVVYTDSAYAYINNSDFAYVIKIPKKYVEYNHILIY